MNIEMKSLLVDSRLTDLRQLYVDHEVLNKELTIDYDPEKEYKLSVLESIYDQQIFDDYVLLRTFRKMYGISRLQREILHTEDNSKLDQCYYPLEFGYDQFNNCFEYSVCTNEVGQVTIRTDEISPVNNLSKLVVYSKDGTQKRLMHFSEYASLEVSFVNAYIRWREQFNIIFQKWISVNS